MLRVIIIDDEPIGINTLKLLIDRLEKDISVVASATDPEKGIEIINSYQPDVVFLDIHMPEINGFELLERLSYKNFKLVFTTAHQEYTIKAIRNRAFDYLLKPIDYSDLKSCIEAIGHQVKPPDVKKHRSLLELSVGDGIIYLKQADIIHVEASGSYSEIYLKNGEKHIASKNLKYFESMLDQDLFYRCHLSHIVNLREIVRLVISDGNYAKMSNDTQVEVGRSQKSTLVDKLKNI
jgi:two-component system, LytTR family, response regulator